MERARTAEKYSDEKLSRPIKSRMEGRTKDGGAGGAKENAKHKKVGEISRGLSVR